MRPATRLRRSLLAFIAFAGCAVVLPFRASLSSGDKDNKKELKAQAEALLAKSRDLSNIEAPGSPAFALDAEIHYQLGTQTAEGDGQIIWLAPDHYRAAYSAPNYFYAEVVRDGYRYLSRTNDEMPFLMYELRQTLKVAMTALPKAQTKVQHVEALPLNGNALTCVTFKPPSTAKLCLDSSSNLARAEYDWPNGSSMLNAQYEFSDFAEFGAKRFPRKIVFRGGDGHTIELDVTRLAFLKNVGSDVFKVPIPSTRETWCAEPKTDLTAARTVWMNPPALLDRANDALRYAGAMIYCVVRPSGRLRSATIIYSSKPVKQKVLDDWIDNERLATLACGNDGIEYQILISFKSVY